MMEGKSEQANFLQARAPLQQPVHPTCGINPRVPDGCSYIWRPLVLLFLRKQSCCTLGCRAHKKVRRLKCKKKSFTNVFIFFSIFTKIQFEVSMALGPIDPRVCMCACEHLCIHRSTVRGCEHGIRTPLFLGVVDAHTTDTILYSLK